MILVLECVALSRITWIASGSPIIAYWEIKKHNENNQYDIQSY